MLQISSATLEMRSSMTAQYDLFVIWTLTHLTLVSFKATEACPFLPLRDPGILKELRGGCCR